MGVSIQKLMLCPTVNQIMLLLVAVHLPEDPAEEDRVPEETFDVKTELQKLIGKYKIIILLLKAKGTIMKPNKELEKPKTPIQSYQIRM